MNETFTRRDLLANAGGAFLGVLFRERFLYSQARLKMPKDPVGMELTITAVTSHTLRISIAAVGEVLDHYYNDGSTAPRTFPKALLTQRTDSGDREIMWGAYKLRITEKPLRITVEDRMPRILQELTFRPEINQIDFSYGRVPVYGLGPGSHPLDRRGSKDMMHNGAGDNLDVFGARNPIPWLMGKNWGLYFHEPGGIFDLTGDIGVFHPSDVARGQDLFLVIADTQAELLRQYAEITGYPHLPAKWTLGYQQSHRTLDSRGQIIEEAKTFRQKRLPCDTMIYLGTGFCPSGWNTGHGSFVFNESVFPDPEKVVGELHDLHFNVVLHVVNPPENLHGEVSDTRAAAAVPGGAANYWAQHVPLVQMGIDGWWPDEGDVLPVASRLVRNRMYWEGGRRSRPDRRPFALHRNCYAGIQRWGWLWSGDTFSTWKTLETQIMMGINAGLNGVPYWGTDIGGFVPTKEFTAELFVRWFQFGAFCPSFRCHGRTWQLRRPWGWNTGSYGPSEMGANATSVLPIEAELHNAAVEPICRKFLETRYKLLPYLYAAAWETHTTGIPLIRSVGLEFPEDEKAWATVDAYLFGPSLLVAPVFEKGAMERQVYLPAGGWWNFWTGESIQGGAAVSVSAVLDSMPVFVRAGTVLPTGPVKQYTYEPTTEPVKLTIYPGANGQFAFYDDDGLTFAYEHGNFSIVEFNWNDESKVLSLKHREPLHAQMKEFVVEVIGEVPQRISLRSMPKKVKF